MVKTMLICVLLIENKYLRKSNLPVVGREAGNRFTIKPRMLDASLVGEGTLASFSRPERWLRRPSSSRLWSLSVVTRVSLVLAG